MSKNYEIERACVELEKELAELESKHRQKKVIQMTLVISNADN